MRKRQRTAEEGEEDDDEDGPVRFREDTSSSSRRYAEEKWASPERGRRAAEGKLNGLVKHLQKQNKIVHSKEDNRRSKGTQVISSFDAKSRASGKRARVSSPAGKEKKRHNEFMQDDEGVMDQQTRDLFAQVRPRSCRLIRLLFCSLATFFLHCSCIGDWKQRCHLVRA
jgi:hypothetical protein